MKKKRFLPGLLLSILTVAALVATVSFQAYVEPGEKFNILGSAGHDISSFSGQVENMGIVHVATSGNVDTGAGYANIKPTDKDEVLYTLTFTPADATKYGDFSFRGQLENAGNVTIALINQFDVLYTFEYLIADANKDFERIGVVSTDGDWLKSVTITNDSFLEVKQIDFSGQRTPVPEPGTFMLLGAGFFGLAVYGKRRKKA